MGQAGWAVTGWGRMLSAGFAEAQGLLMTRRPWKQADGRLATWSLPAAAWLFLATEAFRSPPGLPGGVSAEFPACPLNLIRSRKDQWLIPSRATLALELALRAGAGPGSQSSLLSCTDPGAGDDRQRPQLNSCTMGVLVSKDSETQVGGRFSLRAPLLPSFRVGVLGEESAEGDSEDLNLGAQPATGPGEELGWQTLARGLLLPRPAPLTWGAGAPLGCPLDQAV